jgi:BirA family transcriptional regulator, biotin operon repressor / biotin---[acetyl-CoA-carboxylase] ligase
MTSSPPLNIEDIRTTLETTSLGHPLYIYRDLASTNREAFRLAQNGAAHGTVVLAESQSGGYGRHGRPWFSPPGLNLYCSAIIRGERPRISLGHWLSWTPLISALATVEAVQRITTVSLTLKWPNDLLLLQRKAGGILCESLLQLPADPAIVIGIGLNVNVAREAFPDDLFSIAASLAEISQQPIDRNRLVAQLLLELEHCLDELHSHGSSRLRQAYMARCVTLGRRVQVQFTTHDQVTGIAEDISADGALQIRPLAPRSSSQPGHLFDVRAADVIHLRE